ncbi:MAG: hypothetical protein IJN62_00520 [Clostridia bacterium]|nr:hypothetical protein [Clostridia bacterium]
MSIADKLTTIAENEQKVYDKGVTDGRQAEYDEFWSDAFSTLKDGYGGKHAFAGRCWNAKTFNPPPGTFIPYVCEGMFRESKIGDLAGIMERTGFTIKWSATSYFDCMFINATITHIPVIDLSSAIYVSQTFSSTAIKVIDGIIFPSVARNFKTTFSNATALEEISYIGGTIQGNITLSSCTKLNHDTIMRVINALYDYVAEGSTTTYTLTLGSTNLAKLTDEEKAIATQRGWTLA